MAKKKAVQKDWIREFNDDGLIRVDFLVPLMAQSPGSLLADTVYDMDSENLRLMLDPKLEDDYLYELISDQSHDEICQHMLETNHGKFLAKVSTPVMVGKRFSWGYTYSNYFLGSNMSEVIEKAFKWRASIGKKKKKLKKKVRRKVWR